MSDDLHVVDPLEQHKRAVLAATDEKIEEFRRVVIRAFGLLGVVVVLFGAGFTFTFFVSNSASLQARKAAVQAQRAADEAKALAKAIATLTLTIQNERVRNTRDACLDRNSANRDTKAKLQSAPPEVKRFAGELVDELAKVRNCDDYVAEKIGSTPP